MSGPYQVSTLTRRIERVEKRRGVGKLIVIMREEGTDRMIRSDTGVFVTTRALEQLRAGHALLIREYPAHWLSGHELPSTATEIIG